MFPIRIVLSVVCLWLTAAPFIADAEGQDSPTDRAEQTPSPRILWQQELEGEIRTRRYLGHAPRYPDLSEPNVGIDLDSTRANPVRMVATDKWVYLFDGEGQIERSISLRWDSIPDEVKVLTSAEMRGRTEETLDDYIKRGGDKKFFIRESAIADPKGRFYMIRSQETRGYDGLWTTSIRALNVDGSLRFELRNRSRENPPVYIHSELYLAPTGDCLVVFDNGWGEELPAYLSFYDTTTGALLRHMSEDDFRLNDFSPFGLTFLGDGSQVLLTGFKTKRVLGFDRQGNLLQLPEGARAKLTTESLTQLSAKQAVYRQLVDPQVRLGARPKEVHDIKMLTNQKGVYTSGNTLYLFELQPSP